MCAVLTCAAKGFNRKEIAFLHAHALLATSHYGHALAAMYMVCVYGVAVQIPDTLYLHDQDRTFSISTGMRLPSAGDPILVG